MSRTSVDFTSGEVEAQRSSDLAKVAEPVRGGEVTGTLLSELAPSPEWVGKQGSSCC